MMTIRRVSMTAVTAVAVFSAACRDHEKVRVKANDVNASFAKRDTTRPLGPGDLRIATTDSALEVALVGDSLIAGLGAVTRQKVSSALDTTKVNSSGLGASIEKMVKTTVAGALDHELHVALSEISDIRYEDGLLVFYDKQGKRMHVMERNGDRGHRTKFAEQDAKDFIALFKAKTGRA
jgi:hypothetical protein